MFVLILVPLSNTTRQHYPKKTLAGTDEGEWLKRVGEELADRALCLDHVREIMSTSNMN